ncbi:allantoate permease, putative [Talaromyces stipitatus ATCC 10500]|uniref:Allantoate permease, putative n=1 Tax=Talaromyces stipitatus (strain ATCC 10500 / CBS 375.48 / QM 6759 / NRRL 1006) TaxID=441959 RepID=B8MG55_TALSN|nr:allantoate permease, putative [Talaromyces stipitatus ATCC 10500]EED15922.1 allantoate permease, putative [Talaromyces stipitatus ATCC 10500]
MTGDDEKKPTSAVNNNLEGDNNHENDRNVLPSKRQYTRRICGIRLPSYFNRDPESTVKRKLDLVLLTYTALSIFIKNLDNTNISNAYVSGMQTDLHLYGNQLNIFSTMFNCGIIVGAVPLILLSTHVRPSILMPTCELCWSILVMGIAGAKNYETIYGLRFFIGFFAAIAFPGFASLLAAWYTPAELGKRMAIYEVSQNVAGMFSGYIQAGLYAHMNERRMASWRWLFIFDGIISLPIAIWGFWAIPDQPKDTRAWWLNSGDRTIAMQRMDRVGRKPLKKVNWARFKRIWKTWHVYLFVICYVFYGAFSWGDSYFALWLQSLNKYSVENINNIPTTGQGAAVVNSIVSGFISDWLENRPLMIIINMLICLMGNGFLAVWTAPTALKFVGYIFITTGLPAQSLTMTWLSEVCQGNATLRGLIVSIGNTFIYAINAWALVLLFPALDAPHYKYGYQICAGMIGVGVISVFAILYAISADVRSGRAWRNEIGLLEYERWIRESEEDEHDDEYQHSTLPRHA